MFPHELNRSNTVARSSLAKCEEGRSEDRVELLERSKLISCGHGAKASFVAVWRHASMACPTHSCSAKHISMYGEGTMSTRTCSNCWPRNWKIDDKSNSSQKNKVLKMMGRRIPCKYTAGVEKSIVRCCWKCWFCQRPRAPVLPCFFICFPKNSSSAKQWFSSLPIWLNIYLQRFKKDTSLQHVWSWLHMEKVTIASS